MCLCETKYQGGVSHHFGGVPTPLKVSRDVGLHWAISAIVSQYRAIWDHRYFQGVSGNFQVFLGDAAFFAYNWKLPAYN